KLNPLTASSPIARRYVHGFTHDTLLDIDPRTGNLRPALAEDWRLDADGRTLTVTLRSGVLFSDGTPLTPADVFYTFEVASARDVVLGQIAAGMHLVRAAQLLPGPPPALRIELTSPHFDAVRLVTTSWVVVQKRFFEQRIAEAASERGVPAPTPADAGFGTLL